MSRFARLALALILTWTPGLLAKDYTFDVSGPAGVPDPNGRPSYSPGDTPGQSSFGTGPDGNNGGHAAEISEGGRLRKRGYDGGSLVLNLSVKGDEIVVDGQKTDPEVQRTQRVTSRVPLKASSSLHFRAGGGRGAAGGDGGRGQDGGKGANGRDAFERIPGSDGARGGDGGNEGHSTDGGDAGSGGHITLRVPIGDTDVAMVIDERDISGNIGGPAGRGNGAGEGGDGGDGGASSGYYTTEYRSVPDTVTVEEDGTTTTTSNPDEPYQEWHFTPGGSDGPDGSRGRESSRVTTDGRRSAAGTFGFEVIDDKGKVTRYDEPYYVHLMPGFTMEGSHNGPYLDRDADFFEPGETITIRNLRIKNVGGSPTPRDQRVRLFISDRGWVASNGDEIELPKVLAPGEEYDFGDKPITFRLIEKTRTVAGLMRESDTVSPGGYVTRIGREFANFSNRAERQIRVQYPIEITPLQSLTSVAPGEAMRVLFKVKNISKQTLGSGFSLNGNRYARTDFVRVGGSTARQSFVMSEESDRGGVSPEHGISRLLDGLAPGEEIIVETFIGVRGDAEPYTKVDIQPELFLESILNPNEINRIQYEPYRLNVAEAFKYTPGANVLLISNATLDSKVLDGLRAVARVKQLKMNVWDFSRHGFFNFSHRVIDYGPIFELYRGGTVIILGNPVDIPDGKKVAAHRMLRSDDVIQAARHYGVKIVVVDPSKDSELTVQRLTEPLPVDAPNSDVIKVKTYSSFKEYIEGLKTAIHRVQEDSGDESAFLGTSRLEVHHTPWWPGTGPRPEALHAAGLRILKSTDSYLPESQPYGDTRFNQEPTRAGRKFLFWPTWNLGTVDLLRSVDDSKTSVVAVKITAQDLENPKFVLGEKFSTAFDLALNFTTKLELLNKIILGQFEKDAKSVELPKSISAVFNRDPLEYGRILTHSLLLDLLHEQRMIRPLEFKTHVTRAQLWDKLDLLKRLTQNTYSQFKLNPESREGQLLVDLIVSLRLFNREITTFVQRAGWFWPFTKDKNVEVSEVTKEMLARLITTVFEDAPAATQVIETQLAAWRKDASDQNLTREQMLLALDRDKLDSALVRDGEVNRSPEARLRDEERQAKLSSDEKKRERRAIEIQGSVEAETARLRLDPEHCQSLLDSYQPSDDLIPAPTLKAEPELVPVRPAGGDALAGLNNYLKEFPSGPSGLPPKIRPIR